MDESKQTVHLGCEIVMDYFTKWAEAYAIPNQEANKTVAEVVISRFKVPLELH